MTRVSLLTPAGVAAVAVIAVDRTPDASVGLTDARGRPLAWPAPGRFARARLQLAERLVDDVLVLGRNPGAELHVHGGAAVVEAVLAGLEAATGAAHGRQDSASVVTPMSLRAARALASVRHGALHHLATALHLGGNEERDGEPSRGQGSVERTQALQLALANSRLACRLERPATVRIVGLPNAGKSTLFNALLMEDRALVSSEAGTTRDSVTALTHLEGVALRLEDTEGGAFQEVHRPGADLLVHLLAAPGEVSPPPGQAGVPLIRVLGKIDGQAPVEASVGPLGGPLAETQGVSGRTGKGLPALRARIAAALGLCGGEQDDVLAPVGPGLRRLLRRAVAGDTNG